MVRDIVHYFVNLVQKKMNPYNGLSIAASILFFFFSYDRLNITQAIIFKPTINITKKINLTFIKIRYT